MQLISVMNYAPKMPSAYDSTILSLWIIAVQQ